MRNIHRLIIVINLLFCFAIIANAQAPATADTGSAVEQLDPGSPELPAAEQQRAEQVQQLSDIQESLQQKLSARKNLRQQLDSAGSSDTQQIEEEINELNAEIALLEKTFEQIAIGGIDLSVFGAENKTFDWRDELVLVVKPLIENLKGLTEKPRKIESLRRIVSDKTVAKDTSKEALQSIVLLKQQVTSKVVLSELENMESDWQSRLQDLDREIQLAEFQLESLEGKNIHWFEVFKQGLKDFLSGRGLTILLVVLAAGLVWVFMRALLWLMRKRSSESTDQSSKTHYRLAAYAYRFLTLILIAMAAMMVLYFRQDLLLLAIMVVVFVGAALALKNLLPKYITEGRLLLNMGSVREKERVIYNGLPWEVSNINMYSTLTNPKIRGKIRLPISHMHEMISRPKGGDSWFPSSEGDWILDDSGNPVKVIRQSVDVIELQDLNFVNRFMPSADYFQAGYANLSRAKVFRISVTFGIDYATQAENVETIETAFAKGIHTAFEGTPFAEHIENVNVEFHSAGDSSLNYVMLVNMKPAAAQYYNRIKRRIQRSCVIVCNENDWGIPFPQLSVHLPEIPETSLED